MRRLVNRMVLTHVLVAALAGLATVTVVRMVALERWDVATGQGRGPGRAGHGAGAGFRAQFLDSIDQAVLVGVAVGLVAALVLGLLAARALARPVGRLGQATRELARGNYATPVPVPSTVELADLARDVATLGTTLQETEARRMRLLGEVAHEMRTPLTVIDGYVEAMIDGVVPPEPAELARLGQETRRLRRLSDDLSRLSRAEEGRVDLRLREADLAQTVRAAAERLGPQAEDAGVELLVRGEGVPVRHDPERVAQVVTNLVGNALRATPAGGRITVSTTRAPGEGVVTVADTGVGLAGPDLERIFERFYRVPAPGRERAAGDGSGIGLTVARGIVRAHGGDVTAASPGPGEGAVITARFPESGQPSLSV